MLVDISVDSIIIEIYKEFYDVKLLKYQHIVNICDIIKTKKSHQRELGSSLPTMGGGDTMTKYEKISLIISILSLVVNIIALYK